MAAFTTKTLFIPLAVSALAFSATAGAAEDETFSFDFYGKLNLSLQSSDEGDGSEGELVSNASRVGIKGGAQINPDLEVIYQLEWQVDVDDLGGSDNLSPRNQYVGLRGSFGEITMGRRDTVLKTLQGNIDLFSDYEGDIKAIFAGENRTKNTVSYYSPGFNEFRVAASYILSEDDMVDDGVSFAVTYGDDDLKRTNFYLGAAMDSEVQGYDSERFVASTRFEKTVVGLMYQQQERVDGTAEADGYVVSAKHPVGNFTYKVQYQMMDFTDGDENSIAAGVDYKLGKNTKVFGWYTGRDLDNIDVEQRYFAIGLEHKF